MRRSNILVALAIVVVGLFAADFVTAQTFGQGILRVLINGTRQPSGVAEIQCRHSGAGCYRDAGVVTIDLDQVAGGAVSLDAGAITEGLIATGAVSSSKLADAAVTTDKIANGTILREDFATDLLPDPTVVGVTNPDPGIRLGVIDGGTPGQSVIAARLPQRISVVGSAQSTSAANVAYGSVTITEIGSGFVEQYCVGQQTTYVDGGGAADGGVFLDSGVYHRYTPISWNGTTFATFGGGNVTPLERETISTWSGPGVGFAADGGAGAPVLTLQTTSGVGGTTVDWLCRAEIMLNSERDAGY